VLQAVWNAGGKPDIIMLGGFNTVTPISLLQAL
jgi:hypothetical protein